MITRILIFAIIIAVIIAIQYGRKLIKNEKVDAVFGNPEKAKGGAHWAIVGSSIILLAWLYYSWDIAKTFYPKSANELCQVAKVNDSLLSLKYLFPIEEREFKSTSVIKREKRNIRKLINEVKNSPSITDQDKKEILIFIKKTEQTIPLLTKKSLLNNQTKIKISELSNRIRWLTEDFQKIGYPPIRSIEEENKRIEAIKKQTGWGETEVEIPTLPETKMGLKFDTAAKELTLISDDFFKLRNHNSQYKTLMKEIKDEIKKYRSELDETEEVASTLAKDILKIARRIEYASIFPPKTLDNMQKSILEFDEVQKKEQGNLRLVDIFLFPAGTIISSGPNCSEQGSGRWLPKPSDTINKFIHILNPNVGYMNVPLLWYEMMDVSQIIGFILPDRIADIIPGKYPVHSEDGTVKPNFKSKVLKVASGKFKLFKIPVPSGHIWDSFLRVFLGLMFGIIFGVPLGLFMGLNRFARGFFDPLIELYRPVPPLAWAPLIISVLGIDNFGKIFLLFMVSFSIMIISARAGAYGTQLSKIHASHSLGASNWQILRYVIFPNSLPEILTGVRVAVGMCWGTLVAAEFFAGTTGIGFVENIATKYFQYEIIWITIFVMGILGLLFDIALRKIINKTIPWKGKG
jgi:taurine transport system permease protein